MIKNLKGFFFDLDGTLVDSKLDFSAMRADLGFPEGVGILEQIDTLESEELKEKSREIVLAHELTGAKVSEIYPGVMELLNFLNESKIPTAILTRNCREVTDIVLAKFGINVGQVITREDFKPKPDPEGLVYLANHFRLQAQDCCYIGDFRFDLECAHNAGMKAGLYLQKKNMAYKDSADFVVNDYFELLDSLK